MKTLVVLLGSVRAGNITWKPFCENVLDSLGADLALCVGDEEITDQSSPFYSAAKYIWSYPEKSCSFEKYLEERALKLGGSKALDQWFDFINSAGKYSVGKLYRDSNIEWAHAAGGMLIFFREFLLHNLEVHNLGEHYSKLVVTRSDYLWLTEHPPISNNVQYWDGSFYRGYSDRHIAGSFEYVNNLLTIFRNIINPESALLPLIKKLDKGKHNIEVFQKLNADLLGINKIVDLIPYRGFLVRGNETPVNKHNAGQEFELKPGVYVKYRSDFFLAQFLLQRNLCFAESRAAFMVTVNGEVIGYDGENFGVLPIRVGHSNPRSRPLCWIDAGDECLVFTRSVEGDWPLRYKAKIVRNGPLVTRIEFVGAGLWLVGRNHETFGISRTRRDCEFIYMQSVDIHETLNLVSADKLNGVLK